MPTPKTAKLSIKTLDYKKIFTLICYKNAMFCFHFIDETQQKTVFLMVQKYLNST